MDNFCFYIISCKKNFQILQLLIYTINKNLRKKNILIYVSMDYESVPEKKGNIIYIPNNHNVKFGERMYNSLQHVKEKYIVVLCDDFIVEKKINLSEIETLIKCMEYDNQISSISLETINGKNKNIFLLPSKLGSRYILRDHYGRYKTTLQCSIWNKVAFAKLIKNVNSPWEFELFSNQKSYLYKNKFYALNKNNKRPIEYNRGRFVIRGKIVRPELERLEKVLKQKIKIDGFQYTNSYKQSDAGVLFKLKRRIYLIFGDIYNKVCSYFIRRDLNDREL